MNRRVLMLCLRGPAYDIVKDCTVLTNACELVITCDDGLHQQISKMAAKHWYLDGQEDDEIRLVSRCISVRAHYLDVFSQFCRSKKYISKQKSGP